MTERWKAVIGYEGLYEVSDQGNVRSLDRTITYRDGRVYEAPGKLLRAGIGKVGYKVVSLSRNGKPKVHYVHRLVLETFTGPAPVGQECRHMDGDAMNNRHSNLEWGTRYENIHDQIRHRTHTKFKERTHCPHGHEYTPENTSRTRHGSPVCRACRRAQYWRRKEAV